MPDWCGERENDYFPSHHIGQRRNFLNTKGISCNRT